MEREVGSGPLSRSLRACAAMASATAMLMLGGCAAMYVDGNLPETPKSQFRQPATPPSVQLAFEFQTRSAPNARATQLLKDMVKTQVQDSGLFSSVSDMAAPGSGLLSITLNNIPLTDNPQAKGFVTGLTFGLAGTTVADGYDATIRYMPPPPAMSASTFQAKHVIHTSLGTGSPPTGAIKTSGAEEAVTLMVKQVVSRLLDGLSKDPAFPSGKGEMTAAEAARQP